MSKWIDFDYIGNSKSGKTKVWRVLTKDSNLLLGYIKWYAPWRKYSFFPESNTIFEETCLNDIANFCRDQKKELKNEKKR